MRPVLLALLPMCVAGCFLIGDPPDRAQLAIVPTPESGRQQDDSDREQIVELTRIVAAHYGMQPDSSFRRPRLLAAFKSDTNGDDMQYYMQFYVWVESDSGGRLPHVTFENTWQRFRGSPSRGVYDALRDSLRAHFGTRVHGSEK